ncbi:MAG: ATP-binding protein [Anaerolineae bacterium]|nr:MAG: ATP-binding protein [Anaerolineae bacterium]
MKEIALHLLDLAENSVSAGAKTVKINVCEDQNADLLTASIEDDGRGMTPEMVKMVTDPFVTSRTTRKVGLGIPLFKAAAEACGGNLSIHSTPGVGTRIQVSFQHSHIDRMPLGNLPATFLGLSVAHPEIHWVFRYTARANGTEEPFEYDDQPIKETLDGLPITHPEVLAYLRNMLEEGIGAAQQILKE